MRKMNIRNFPKLLVLTAAIISGCLSFEAWADKKGNACSMTYKLSGWSFVYKQYNGSGYITCSNGQHAQVKLESKGGGFTVGRSEIEGTGEFTEVKDIKEVYGTYVSVEGHAGAAKSAQGMVLTKGIISLALSGTGRGIDIGVSFGGLKISPLGQ